MDVILSAPEVAFRPCSECIKWIYDDDGQKMGHGKFIGRDGKPMRRPEGTSPPCWKCPKGPEPFKKELTARNLTCFWHYMACKAVGRFPDDPIVLKNAALIRWVEDQVQRSQSNVSSIAEVVAAVLGAKR